MAKINSTSTLFVLGIAIIIALSVAFVSYKKVQEKYKSQHKNPETCRVAVAVYNLPWGTLVDKKMFKFVPFLKKSLPSGTFSDSSSLQGRTLIYPVKANEPIFESQLAPTSVTTGGIAAVVAPKKRAMSVKVDKVVGISGFIHPGNRVDVLVTMSKEGRNGAADIPVTKTILENILVIASGSDVEEDKQQKAKGVDVITLEVTPEEGEKLALATTKGKIQLALRNFTDSEMVLTNGTTLTNLLASHRMAEVTKVTKKSVEPAAFSVTLIKGNTVNELMF